jgi:hypothetical protein
MRKTRYLLAISCLLNLSGLALLTGCSPAADKTANTKPLPSAADDLNKFLIKRTFENEDYQNADFRVLFIGNSHTSTHQMPKTVQKLLNAAASEKNAFCETCAAGFLTDHVNRKVTLDLIKQGNWDYVVLQAQKYSTSGKYQYPYDAALKLTKLANENGAKVIMYPEFSQRGNKEEAARVHELHQLIASKSGAEVAPVGLVWDVAIQQEPELVLHAYDGNHASEAGAFLTAAVFYQVLSGQDIAKTEPINVRQVDQDLQLKLKRFVSDYFANMQKAE